MHERDRQLHEHIKNLHPGGKVGSPFEVNFNEPEFSSWWLVALAAVLVVGALAWL